MTGVDPPPPPPPPLPLPLPLLDGPQVHPSRQHLCVTGGTAGEVAVWDLRFSQRPVMHCPADPEQQADIWEVRGSAFGDGAGKMRGCRRGGAKSV